MCCKKLGSQRNDDILNDIGERNLVGVMDINLSRPQMMLARSETSVNKHSCLPKSGVLVTMKWVKNAPPHNSNSFYISIYNQHIDNNSPQVTFPFALLSPKISWRRLGCQRRVWLAHRSANLISTLARAPQLNLPATETSPSKRRQTTALSPSINPIRPSFVLLILTSFNTTS
jgi:hypothetical protein